jgi:hypothetical protein
MALIAKYLRCTCRRSGIEFASERWRHRGWPAAGSTANCTRVLVPDPISSERRSSARQH